MLAFGSGHASGRRRHHGLSPVETLICGLATTASAAYADVGGRELNGGSWTGVANDSAASGSVPPIRTQVPQKVR